MKVIIDLKKNFIVFACVLFCASTVHSQPSKPIHQMSEAERQAYIEEMQERAQQMINQHQHLQEQGHLGTIPTMQTFEQQLEKDTGQDKYNQCLDNKLGKGASDQIQSVIIQSTGQFMQIAMAAQSLCAQNKRDEAVSYFEENTLAAYKELFPKQFEAIKACHEMPENEENSEHPCD